MGLDFVIVLTKCGLLYSMGSNSEGELGLGDYNSRHEFT